MEFMDMYKMDYLYGQLKVLESKEQPLEPGKRLQAAEGPLLSWYEKNHRLLPWREQPEAYRVWISEIMLQQTRVEAVKPYFAHFMQALPDISALAEVEEETLLKLWEGLGYYNRARNLQKAALVMQEEYGGEMPSSYEEILKLPGIGSYTAGAISSIAFGIAEPAVDGNVLRVMARLLNDSEDITKASVKKRVEQLIREHMPKKNPGDYNQAWIELGAIVCLPNGRPLCESCPLNSLCLAHRAGTEESLPVKAAKKPRKIEERTVFLLEWQDKTAIRQRSSKGLLASLYEFPNVLGYVSEEKLPEALELSESEIVSWEKLPDAVHIFSHVEWHMIGYRVRLNQDPSNRYQMVCKEEILEKYPLPNAFGVYTKALM